jgi:hypothetical protein
LLRTARQSAGAIGIAIAGAPSHVGSFLSGFHALALAAAGLYVIVAGVSTAFMSGRAGT